MYKTTVISAQLGSAMVNSVHIISIYINMCIYIVVSAQQSQVKCQKRSIHTDKSVQNMYKTIPVQFGSALVSSVHTVPI